MPVRLIILLMLLPMVAEAQLPGRERRLERREAAAEEYPGLSRQLQNPLARILVLPASVEYYDGGGVLGDGEAWMMRLGPRIPIHLNDDWHVLSKSELTWSHQRDITPGSRQEGFGDLVQTFFFSPDRSLAHDIYWGLGPTFVLPTASHELLGSDRFSVGPSFGFFRQREGLTTGVILNQLWSVAGRSSAGEVNASRVEPLIAYTLPSSTSLVLSAELTYDWGSHDWVGPVDLRVTQLTLFGDRPVQWGFGVRYFPFRQTGEPEWGALFQISFPIESPRWGSGF